MKRLQDKKREFLRKTVLENSWIPKEHRMPQADGKGLTEKQAHFLLLTCREAFYGGAAGGGKSEALLMGALQFVDIPGYNAILFRRTYTDLSLPNALMDRAYQWLGGTTANWHSLKHTWTFPSGATLTFGNLEYDRNKFRYQSAEFQFIGFDELTQFLETQYVYLFSRLRRLEGVPIPLRMRSASNPGNIGHEWVKQRFLVEGPKHGRVFIPAKLDDNPNLDRQTYIESLNQLDPITRLHLLNGDWSARHAGNKFRREWFKIVDDYPADAQKVRYWDLAATTPKRGQDPDYTAGALVTEKNGVYYIINIRRKQMRPAETESLIKQTAVLDGKEVDIYMEQEPGASGVIVIDHYAREVLLGYSFRGVKSTGEKEVRANPVSSAAEAGNIMLVRGDWINDFLDEAELFPLGAHDDQIDVISGAVAVLSQTSGEIRAERGRRSYW